MIPLSKSGVSGTVIKGNIEINPKRNPMTKESYGGLSGREVDNWKSRGASPLDVTTATLMHELLHITKYFKPDGDYDESGKPQKSIDNQAELEKKCFPKKEGQN